MVDARTTYDRLGLRSSSVARHDGQILLFPWVGDRKQQAFILALAQADLEPVPLGIAVGISAGQQEGLVKTLSALTEGPPAALELAGLVRNKVLEKFDPFLGDELLDFAWARDRLDVTGLPALAADLLKSLQAVEMTAFR